MLSNIGIKMLKIQNIINCKLKIKDDSGVKDISVKEIINNRFIVLFGVPGAFTPTCSVKHLPSYIKNYKDIHSLGVDEIICVSVNDPFVMHAWGKFNNTQNKITMMSDVGGNLARAMGIEANFGPNLLNRMERFSLIIKDNEIKSFIKDERGSYGKTSAENMISELKNIP